MAHRLRVLGRACRIADNTRPIAINTATFVGYLMGGIWGSIVATFSSIAVPFLLVYSMSSLLNKVNPVYLDMFLTT